MDNWKKLQSTVKVEATHPLEKKINHLKKVILDPDGYNTNLASKESLNQLHTKIDKLDEKLNNIKDLLIDIINSS